MTDRERIYFPYPPCGSCFAAADEYCRSRFGKVWDEPHKYRLRDGYIYRVGCPQCHQPAGELRRTRNGNPCNYHHARYLKAAGRE